MYAHDRLGKMSSELEKASDIERLMVGHEKQSAHDHQFGVSLQLVIVKVNAIVKKFNYWVHLFVDTN